MDNQVAKDSCANATLIGGGPVFEVEANVIRADGTGMKANTFDGREGRHRFRCFKTKLKFWAGHAHRFTRSIFNDGYIQWEDTSNVLVLSKRSDSLLRCKVQAHSKQDHHRQRCCMSFDIFIQQFV
jgi:hypothetical protein